MKRIHALTGLACAGLLLTAPAEANSGRSVTPPPVVLSPDLTEPWLLQLQPRGHRAVAAPPAVRMPGPRFGVRQAALQPRQQTRPRNAIDPRFLPQVVDYDGNHPRGTIIVNTQERFLYLVEGDGQARRYGIGVGRPGFTWAGEKRVTRKAEWPDWRPPAEMRQRQPHLPEFMEGGPDNPLGARALYLGSSLYRIHGSNEPWTIGQAVSSGCIRMRNEDVIDLYERVRVGTRVIVI